MILAFSEVYRVFVKKIVNKMKNVIFYIVEAH